MKAIIRDRYGDASTLELVERERPTPGPGRVLVRVHASSINAGDRLMMRGHPYLMRLALGLFKPRSGARGMGQDVAGVIEAVGEGVTGWAPGDRVYAEVALGATWAEYDVVKASALARMPENRSFEEAATVPVAAVTALQAVRDHGRVQPGQSVLINGASGGVGTWTLQVAVALGAEVTAVVRTRHIERARGFGAARVIDSTAEDFTQTDRRYDVVLDVAGRTPLAACRGVLKPEGTYVAVGGPVQGLWIGAVLRPLRVLLTGLFTRQQLVAFVTGPNAEDLTTLTGMLEREEITPFVERSFPLEEAPAAVALADSGAAWGKVAITVA